MQQKIVGKKSKFYNFQIVIHISFAQTIVLFNNR